MSVLDELTNDELITVEEDTSPFTMSTTETKDINIDINMDINVNTNKELSLCTPLQELLHKKDFKKKKVVHVCKYGTCCQSDRGVSKQKELVRGASSSWSFFVAKNRLPKETLKQAQSRLSEQWRTLTEKEEYEKLAEQDKQRFYKDLARLNPSEQQILASYHTQQRQRKRMQQPLTAYNVFVRKRRPQLVLNHPELSFGEITSLLAKEWHKCDSEERNLFAQEANQFNNPNA